MSYIDLYQEFRQARHDDKEYINDDLIFEMELIKQVDITIDYILELIHRYKDNCQDKELLININKSVKSSIELRSKKDLILQFVKKLNTNSNVYDDWQEFINDKKTEELNRIINEEELNKKATYKFINNAFRDGYIQESGTAITKILPSMTRFNPDQARSKKKETVLEKLINFFNRFLNISNESYLKE